MKLFWYIVSLFTIFLILINNPKATNLGNFGDQSRILNSTRSTQKGLQIIIFINIIIFFLLTIFSALDLLI